MPAALGAVLVVTGCAGLGLAALYRLIARVKVLSAFMLLADRLGGEIGFFLTPLPELPERLPELRRFWEVMDYRPYGAETYQQAWSRAAESLDITEADRSLVREIGGVLGRYDAENQTRTLSLLRKQLEISLSIARENRAKYGRLYGMLGLLGGILLVVIFI